MTLSKEDKIFSLFKADSLMKSFLKDAHDDFFGLNFNINDKRKLDCPNSRLFWFTSFSKAKILADCLNPDESGIIFDGDSSPRWAVWIKDIEAVEIHI